MTAHPAAVPPAAGTASEVAKAMSRPAFYGLMPGEEVERRETHASVVFLAGDRAYKLKKPVVHPFLDYGTAERRREMCRAEVELNRRLAPDVYLGVRAVVRRDGRWGLAPDGAHDAMEHVVEMTRFDEETTFAAALAAGRATTADARAIGRRLAAFHVAAPVVTDPTEQLAEVRRSIAETLATLWAHATSSDSPEPARAERFAAAFLAAHSREIAARAAAGRVREGHGDLRAEHILLTPDGIEIVDCIEFDARLRTVDVGADLAFLVMDLARLGADDLTRELLSAYREAGGDPGPPALIAFHAATRAWVRAKVARLAPAGARGAGARELMDLGSRLAWRTRMPLVLSVCGLPASGKSTLAGAIGADSGLPVIGSDVTRKRLAGLAPTEPAGAEAYTDEFSRRTYRELGRVAGVAAASAGGAVVDATMRRRVDREALHEGLSAGGVPLVAVECIAPRELRRARAREREASGDGVSDAGPDVVARLDAQWEPLDELMPHEHLVVRTDRPAEEALCDVTALLDLRAP